jgi:hypothetical protein
MYNAHEQLPKSLYDSWKMVGDHVRVKNHCIIKRDDTASMLN